MKYLLALGISVLCSFGFKSQNSYTVLSDFVNPWPLDIVVGDAGGIQIFDQNSGQLYYPFLYPNSPWIFNSVYLAVDDHLIASNSYAIDIEDENWDQVASNVTDVSGMGTRSDPWLITQELRASNGYGVDIHYYYVNGDDFFVTYYEVIVPNDNTAYIKLYHILDTYLGGTDTGPAFTEGTSPNFNIVGTITNDRYIVFGNPDMDFTAFGSHNWYWMLNEPVFGNDLQNILDFDTDTDNGIGVQWSLGYVMGKQEAIGTHMAFAPDIPVTLPVEWVSFEASNKTDYVSLEWVTAAEVNNDYFEVERSTDGQNWEAIERVYGAGYSTSLTYYEAKDEHPFSGESYYRVRQVDFDGTTDYSEIDVVIRKAGEITSLYPNPSKGVFRFDLEADHAFEGFLELIDIHGNLLYAEELSFDKGINILFNNFIDIPKGSYILRIHEKSGTFKVDKKFLII
ncbi:MAG: T9SS type A sorting domain-containing protein [Bacteroidota bacterium]